MTSKIVHHDRNGHIISNLFHFDAMTSSLAKVMSLQVSENEDPKMHLLKEHGSRHEKVIQHDRSDNISHTASLF